MSLETAKSIKAIIQPNAQLAQLALPSVRAMSLGEIDILLTETSLGNVCLRMRALVMSTLSVPCYGGRTFHRDNHIVDCATTSIVTLHGGRFSIKMSHISPPPMPPPYITFDPKLANVVAPVPSEPEVPQNSVPQSPPTPSTLPPKQSETTVLVKEKTSIRLQRWSFFHNDGMVMFFFPRHHCHRWFFNGFIIPGPSPLNVFLQINH